MWCEHVISRNTHLRATKSKIYFLKILPRWLQVNQQASHHTISKHSTYRDPNSPWLRSSNDTLRETVHPAAILPKTSKEVSTQKPPCTPLKNTLNFQTSNSPKHKSNTIMNKNKKEQNIKPNTPAIKGSAVRSVSRSKTESPWLYLPIVENTNKANTSAPASRATRLQHMHDKLINDNPFEILQQAFYFMNKIENFKGRKKKLPPFFKRRRRGWFLELDDTLQWNILASHENRLVSGKRRRRRRRSGGWGWIWIEVSLCFGECEMKGSCGAYSSSDEIRYRVGKRWWVCNSDEFG